MKKILIILIAVLSMASFAGCVTDKAADVIPPEYITGDEIAADTDADGEAENDDSSKNLVIPLSGLTASAQFFGVTVDGTYMEVIAFKSGSAYRTAFNTCQICYGSRTAYYKQSGSYLVCQNCGSKFALSNVGLKTSSYTCSPYPILETDRTTDSENIIISYEFLVRTKNLFKTWKVT